MENFDLHVYKFFNPELCYMNDEELYNSNICGRIYSLDQVYRYNELLKNHCDGYDFDPIYYNKKYGIMNYNKQDIEFRNQMIKHFIYEGYYMNYYGNIKQEESNTTNEVGVNFFGYGGTIIGQGVSANCIIESLKTLDIPVIINNVNCKIPSCELDKNLFNNKYKINVIHINPDRADIYIVLKSFMKDRINIAVWTWETEEIPVYWIDYIHLFHEIWTISSFTADSISKVSSVPVINIRPPIYIEYKETGFGDKFLKKNNIVNKYIYFYSFDFVSYVERKNPYVLIEAFKKIKDENSVLILKTMNMPKDFEEKLKGYRIIVINNSIDSNDYFSLVNICHCYVSPHRCEGQGRTIMEAMYFGKKVIATGYSGNLDFMDINNSYHIKWKYITAKEDGIYKGHKWAEPSLHHLIKLMKIAKIDWQEGRILMNKKAEEMMKTKFSYKSCASTINYRLKPYIHYDYINESDTQMVDCCQIEESDEDKILLF